MTVPDLTAHRPSGFGRTAPRTVSRLFGAMLAAGIVAVLAGCSLLAPIEANPPAERTIGGYAAQEVSWRLCSMGEADCARVSAPLDWDDVSGSESIELALVRLPSFADTPLGTIFVNPGGPGALGTEYVLNASTTFDSLREQYDIIGWDPRGVGRSSAVECLTDSELDDYLFGADENEPELGSDAWFDAYERESAAFGEACLEHTGELLRNVDTLSTVHDLDLLRQIVGDPALNYFGFSYGTYIGALYVDTYPERVGRVVLDGAVDPAADTMEVVRAQTRGFEATLVSYLETCGSREACPFVAGSAAADAGSDSSAGSVDVEAAKHQIHALLRAAQETPLETEDGRPVDEGTLLTGIITPLYSPSMWTFLDSVFAEARDGRGDTALEMADFYYDRSDGEYANNSTEAFTAINCADYPAPGTINRDEIRANAAALADEAPVIGAFQGYGELACVGWPDLGEGTKTTVTGSGADPVLVVGTTGDPATPYHWAEALAEQLESGILVTYVGEGHTAYGKDACVNRLVDHYFFEGAVPGAQATCKA